MPMIFSINPYLMIPGQGVDPATELALAPVLGGIAFQNTDNSKQISLLDIKNSVGEDQLSSVLASMNDGMESQTIASTEPIIKDLVDRTAGPLVSSGSLLDFKGVLDTAAILSNTQGVTVQAMSSLTSEVTRTGALRLMTAKNDAESNMQRDWDKTNSRLQESRLSTHLAMMKLIKNHMEVQRQC